MFTRRSLSICYAVIVLIVLLSAVRASFNFNSKRPTGPSSQDMQNREMRNLLSQEVTSMRHVERPLGSLNFKVGPLSHSGVLVNTRDGGQYLVHKGNDFGRQEGGNTVVTKTDFMSNKWSSVGSQIDVRPGTTVSDLIRAGGKDYSLLSNNCHEAAHSMMDKRAAKDEN